MPRGLLVLLLLVVTGCGGGGDVGAPVASASPSVTAGPDGCPGSYPADLDGPWVPAPPTTETPGRLAPDADPVTALVCRYGDLAAGAAPLAGQVELTGGLDRVRHDLLLPERVAGQQPACTPPGGPRVPHLVRFSYADGDLWVSSVAGSCEGASNGAFTSGASVGAQLAASYDAGSWVAPTGAGQPAPG